MDPGFLLRQPHGPLYLPPRNRGYALERGTDSNNHNLQITRGMASVLRPGEKLSPKDQSQPVTSEMGTGAQRQNGAGFSKAGTSLRKKSGREACFLPSFRRPRNSPRAGASSRAKGVGISTGHFRKPDSTSQHVKAQGSPPSRRLSHASQGAS